MPQAIRVLVLIAVYLASVAAAFVLGRDWTSPRFLGDTRYVTTEPLTLYPNSEDGGPPGVLPKGTMLYDFNGPDGYPHFVLIVGSKALAKMRVDTRACEFCSIPADAEAAVE